MSYDEKNINRDAIDYSGIKPILNIINHAIEKNKMVDALMLDYEKRVRSAEVYNNELEKRLKERVSFFRRIYILFTGKL